jgi:hypothetical protein
MSDSFQLHRNAVVRTSAPRQPQSGPVEGFTVRPDVLAAAHRALRPGERLVFRGPTEVDLVRDERPQISSPFSG